MIHDCKPINQTISEHLEVFIGASGVLFCPAPSTSDTKTVCCLDGWERETTTERKQLSASGLQNTVVILLHPTWNKLWFIEYNGYDAQPRSGAK